VTGTTRCQWWRRGTATRAVRTARYGATLQSAASALALAGATVVAGVVLGRLIDVSDDERYAGRLEFWRQQARLRFSFDVCCLE
jgi:hypothetical protein